MSGAFGRRALIVGASRGLGLGLVRRLLRRQWDVTATVRRATPDLVAGAKLGVESVIDIDDDAAVQRLHKALADEPPFDLVFVVAGVSPRRPARPRGSSRARSWRPPIRPTPSAASQTGSTTASPAATFSP